MAVFTVTTREDVVDAGDGWLSLREAVRAANAVSGTDRITFADGVEGGTLALERRQLVFYDDLRIDGGAGGDRGGTTIDGDYTSRLLRIDGTGTNVRLEDLTLTGGYLGYGSPDPAGGAIHVGSGDALEVIRSEIIDNTIADYFGAGGGIFADRDSRVTIADSVVADNFAPSGGGVVGSGSRLYIVRSYLNGNGASEAG